MAETKQSPPARPFLFVNHAAGSLDARPHRHAVFTHVQRSWKHWRKAEDAQAPKSGPRPLKKKESPATQVRWKIPQYQNGQTKVKAPSSEPGEEPPTFLDGTEANEVLSAPVPSKPETLYRTQRKSTQSTSDRSPSPLSLVREGNSDPFGVFAIPIDAKVNALMKYTRDVYLPGIQGDLNNPGSPAIQREWTECVTFLRDECLASAHLARIASIVASDADLLSRNPTFQTQALVLKSRTMTILRARLMKSLHDARACNTILMLLNAELYARNLDAAECHAAVLARLLQSGSVKTEPIFLFKILYHDTQRATMSLTRPSFDFQQWIPDTFNPIFIDPVIDQLPDDISSKTLADDIDSSIDDFPALKHIFATLKHCLRLSLLGFKDPTYATFPIVIYGRITATLTMGRLLNQYLDAADALEYVDDPSSRMQAYISLTTLLWMRSVSRIDNVKIDGNIRIFAANEFILDTLRKMLMKEVTNTENNKIKLWVLYTSACVEMSLGKTTLNDSWLVKMFLQQTQRMNLHSWAESKEVLQGFLYTELLPPNGSAWSDLLDDP